MSPQARRNIGKFPKGLRVTSTRSQDYLTAPDVSPRTMLFWNR